jgi:hypothetical protein
MKTSFWRSVVESPLQFDFDPGDPNPNVLALNWIWVTSMKSQGRRKQWQWQWMLKNKYEILFSLGTSLASKHKKCGIKKVPNK